MGLVLHMKKIWLCILFISCLILVHAKDPAFLLSSEKFFQDNPAALKDLHSFIFSPLLHIEKKNVDKILGLIEQELNKIACVVKRNILTSDGVDLESFSNPTLQFTIEQLVDQNGKPLSVLLAALSVRSVVEMSKNNQLTSTTTNRWCAYLKKTNDVQKAIKETLPHLLKEFIEDFQRINGANQKPTIFITYDSFWWKNQSQ